MNKSQKKVNYVVVILTLMTIIFAVLSFVIAIKLKEKKSTIGVIKTKASSQTYKKIVQLAPSESLPSSELSTNSLPTETIEPTVILAYQAVPSQTEVALQLSPTIEAGLGVETATPTKRIILELPQSGNINLTSIVFFTSLGLIFFSFIL